MEHKIYGMAFARVYPAYVAKAERKGRSRDEVDQVIRWLTGYSEAGLAEALADGRDIRTFFADAPALNPARAEVTGVICGVRIETLDDPLMKDIRILDKLIDELARGLPLSKVLRSG